MLVCDHPDGACQSRIWPQPYPPLVSSEPPFHPDAPRPIRRQMHCGVFQAPPHSSQIVACSFTGSFQQILVFQLQAKK